MEKMVNGVLMAYPDKGNEVTFYIVSTVTPLPDYMLYLTFKNGEHRIFDVKQLFSNPKFSKVFMPLKTERGLFNKVKVGTAGYGVYWNDYINFGCNSLYAKSIALDSILSITTKPKTTRTKKVLTPA